MSRAFLAIVLLFAGAVSASSQTSQPTSRPSAQGADSGSLVSIFDSNLSYSLASAGTVPLSITLSTYVSPPGSGIISANPPTNDETYPPGTTVQLTAVPNTGYRFLGWTGDLTGSTASQSLILNITRSVIAIFTGSCLYNLSAGAASVGTGGANGTVDVIASSGCTWTASSKAPWISISGGATGSGFGRVSFAVQANSGAARSGALLIAGQLFTINQTDGCIFGLSPTSAAPAALGGSSLFTVGASSASCTWTASSNAPWLAINGSVSKSGSDTVNYTVAGNPANTSRNATITITGPTSSSTFTLVQGGACSYSLQQASQAFADAGGSGTATVLAPGGCPWTATSNNSSTAAITAGASGNGNGNVSYAVAANTGGARTATLTIAGRSYTVTQSPAAAAPPGCTASAPAAPQVALEGRTEKVGDLVLICSGPLTADITLRLNTNVTNTLAADGSSTDAALSVNSGAPVNGRISGYNTIRWAGVSWPSGGGTIRITKVRADASLLSLSAGLQAASVTGQVSVSTTAPVPVANNTQTLANALPLLVFLKDAATTVGSQTTLKLHYEEGSSAAFLPATRLRLVITNVPASAQVYAPIFSVEGAPRLAQLYSADSNGSGGSPLTGPPLPGNTQDGNLYQTLPANGGTATATWLVLSTDPTQLETLTFPIVIVGASSAELNQVQVAASVGPISSIGVASVNAPVPRYRDLSTPQKLVNLRISTSLNPTAAASALKSPERAEPSLVAHAVTVGSKVTFTTTLLNDSSDPTQTATNVVVRSTLPSGLTLVSCSASGTSCSGSGSQVVVNTGTLGPGQSQTVTVVGQVDPSVPDGTAMESPVSASGDQVNADLLAGSASTSFVVLNGTPVVVGGTPAAGGGPTQTFTFQFSHPAGFQSLGVVNILINSGLDGRNACYLAYAVQSTTLYLVNDAGQAGGPYAGTAVLGSSSAIQNSQCAVTLVSATGSGTTLPLVLNIAFKPAFGGNRVMYVAARDQGTGNSDWQALGVWQAPFTPSGAIAVTGVTPARGAGPPGTGAQFKVTLNDTKGGGDLGVVNLLINNSIDGRHACYLAYSAPGNSLFLVNDTGDAGGPFAGSMLLNGTNTGIENGQCAVNGSGSSVSFAAGAITLTLNVTFKSAFAGNRVLYVAGRDRAEGNNTDWQAVGTWTVNH